MACHGRSSSRIENGAYETARALWLSGWEGVMDTSIAGEWEPSK